MTAKDLLRREARANRAQLAAQVGGFSERIAGFAAELPIPAGSPIASFCALRDEADPQALALALAQSGNTLALPCVVGRARPLVFRRWQPGDALVPGVMGIAEPEPSAPVVSPQALLVPLLAFDAAGYRLGYGGGYYDRTLGSFRARGPVLAIGIAYAGQEVPRLPADAHDERLDMVVTEGGVRRFGN